MDASPLDALAQTERMIVREHMAKLVAESPPLAECQVRFFQTLFTASPQHKDDLA